MEFYVYLSLLTILFGAVTLAVWRKTKAFAFMMGAFFLYFWSLFGGWNLVTSLRTGENTPYLFYKLFPVFLDDDYRNALLLYGAFIITVMMMVLICAKAAEERVPPRQIIEISHWKALVTGAFCGGLGFLFIRSAVSGSASAYAQARELPGYSLFQILNHGGLCIAVIGLATLMAGKRARFIGGRSSRLALMGYLGLLGALMLLLVKMGNRSEAALTFVLLLLFYMANTVKPSRILLVGTGTIGLVVLMIVKLFRDSLLSSGSGMNAVALLTRVKSELMQSTESVAAHLSMYGALHKHLPFTWGSSFLSLAASVIPRGIWKDRPTTIYEYYATGVAAMEGQGYTIHHATGWYLNFGVVGVFAGAVMMGWCWAKLYNMVYDGKRRSSAFANAFAVIAFWTFTAGIPELLRAGPEAYKTTVISEFLLPTFLVTLCSASIILRHQRPAVVFRHHASRRVNGLREGGQIAAPGVVR